MCQIIRERYGCCPDKVRREYIHICASRFWAVGPGVKGQRTCIKGTADRIGLRGEECAECKMRERCEEKRRHVLEWLWGVDEDE